MDGFNVILFTFSPEPFVRLLFMILATTTVVVVAAFKALLIHRKHIGSTAATHSSIFIVAALLPNVCLAFSLIISQTLECESKA